MLLRKGTLSPFLSPFFYSKELLARWLRRKVAKPAFGESQKYSGKRSNKRRFKKRPALLQAI